MTDLDDFLAWCQHQAAVLREAKARHAATGMHAKAHDAVDIGGGDGYDLPPTIVPHVPTDDGHASLAALTMTATLALVGAIALSPLAPWLLTGVLVAAVAFMACAGAWCLWRWALDADRATAVVARMRDGLR